MTHWLAGLLVAYGVATLWLLIGMSRRHRKTNRTVTVSLVICLRNEETNLPGLLRSLNALDYPEDRLEIILVNDRSSDSTGRQIEDFRSTARFPVIVENVTAEISGFPGKMGALIRGLKLASNDLFVLTDADARPRPDWIRRMVSYFNDDIGLVGGPIRITGTSLWARLQALDWTYLFAVGAGTAGWNVPQSVFGKNAAIRAMTYQDIGTLEAVPFSVTEDLALLAAVRDRTRWKIRLPLEKSLAVDVLPTPNLRTLWHQRRRWLLGGMKITLVGRLLILIMLFLTLAIWLSLFLSPLWAMGLFAIQCLIDLPLAGLTLARLGRLGWIAYWIPYRLVFAVLVLPVVGSLLVTRSIHWKGQILKS